DPNYAIDETSREFQMLNPSTKPTYHDDDNQPERNLTAVEEEELDEVRGSDEDTSSFEEEEKEVQPKTKDSGRLSSSTYRKSGHRPQQPQPQIRISSSRAPQRAKDRTFGDRAERVKAPRPSAGAVVGEREITFAPERKGKGRGAREGDKPEMRRKKEGRRSASGNVLRNL
ncbi:MAG: hypothetical protein Q9204_009270, partial [Flavoplaca sp. TL-2023a]